MFGIQTHISLRSTGLTVSRMLQMNVLGATNEDQHNRLAPLDTPKNFCHIFYNRF
jgi:hypothetical protein